MTEAENPVKVYELAKELGIDSISLLDKLRDLNIKVKSHMSELSAEEATAARDGLLKKAAAGKDGKTAGAKKPAAKTRKKPTTEAAATAESPAAPAKTTKTVKRSTATAEPSATETPAAAKASAAPARGSSVIRRRTKDDGVGVETVTAASTAPIETTEAQAEVPLEADESQAAAPASTDQESHSATTADETPSIEASTPSALTEVAAQLQAAPPAAALAPVANPSVIRRSVLKIVEAAALPQRPMVKPALTPATSGSGPKINVRGTTQTQDKDGFRIIKMTKENLDQMAEEEAAKKRGGPRGGEIRPEDVRFADYRKKEMVFLPKKKKIPMGKELKRTEITESSAQKRVIDMGETIALQEFAHALSVKAPEVIKKLMMMGQMVNMNSSLDFDTASLVAAEFKYEVRNVAFKENEVLAVSEKPAEEDPSLLEARPPIVTIMGHVDHGKTTLLDSIREASVAAGEAGGITQHIGAYTIEKNGKLITFIDTPGHEAFTAMRARGANATDIVIIVVSADDGVMPQTREAISHAQAAKVPIIVAVNKIDKPGANPEKIKQALAELSLLAEDWGGDTMFVPVSALKKTNLDKLLEAILLQAEVLDLKANPHGLASGTILEARLEKGRGAVVSVLIGRGTLKAGDPIVSGISSGKVRALMDDRGRTIKEAKPGVAVEILGFEFVPNAGERFNATASDEDARAVAAHRVDVLRNQKVATSSTGGKVSLEDLFAKVQAGAMKELNVVLKADVFGSVEAIRESLAKTGTEKVKVKVIHSATGGITESDVLLASASNAVIVGFNVRPETKARQVAEAEHVEIKCYSIIYELIDDIKNAMAGLLDKKKVERFLGRAEVRQVFSIPRIGTIAGSAVVDGKILRGANVRLLRDSRIVFEGKMHSLKRFKDDAKEVATGFECGIGIENYNDLKPGDIIEAYQIDLVASTLDA